MGGVRTALRLQRLPSAVKLRYRHRRQGLSLKSQRLRVALTAEVMVGQQIRLGIPQASILRGLLWCMCCRSSACCWAPCWASSGWPPAVGGEGVTILSCLLGGTIGFLLVRYFSARLEQGSMVPACSAWYSIPVTSPERRYPFLAPSPPFWCRGPARKGAISGARRLKIGRRPGYPVKSCPHIRP